jgi:hypothetical protein
MAGALLELVELRAVERPARQRRARYRRAVDGEVDAGVPEERSQQLVLDLVERHLEDADAMLSRVPHARDVADRRHRWMVEDRHHGERVVGVDQERLELSGRERRELDLRDRGEVAIEVAAALLEEAVVDEAALVDTVFEEPVPGVVVEGLGAARDRGLDAVRDRSGNVGGVPVRGRSSEWDARAHLGRDRAALSDPDPAERLQLSRVYSEPAEPHRRRRRRLLDWVV